ncbi:Calx-beta domain-containing protein, partial [Planctomycetota bacterium]
MSSRRSGRGRSIVGGAVCLAILGLVASGCDVWTDSDTETLVSVAFPASVVSFAAPASTTAGEAGAHSVPLILSGPTLTADLKVAVVSSGGTATAGGDYEAVLALVTFPADSNPGTTANLDLKLLDDALVEGNETVSLHVAGIAGHAVLGSPATHTVTIRDDDPTVVSFASTTSATGNEAGGAHAVTLVLSGPQLITDLTVTVASVGGTAAAGSDYTAVSKVVTFAAGSSAGATEKVSLDVLADTLVEGNETIVLGLKNPSAGHGLGAQATHTLTVTDDDVAELFFTSAASSATESTTPHVITVGLGISTGTLAVPLPVTIKDLGSGSATAGLDFALADAGTVTFPAGAKDGATQTVALGLIPDSRKEADERIALGIGLPASVPLVSRGAQATHEVTVIDGDWIGLGFAQINSQAPESVGTHPVDVLLSTHGATLT